VDLTEFSSVPSGHAVKSSNAVQENVWSYFSD